MPGPDTQSFDPQLVTIIVAIVGVFGTVLVAVINKAGARKTQVAVEMGKLVEFLQKERDAKNVEIAQLKDELRDVENLRRAEFDAAVRKLFPELDPPKE